MHVNARNLVAVAVLAALAPAQTFTTRHFDEVVPLQLDATRVVLLHVDEASTAQALAAAGLDATSSRALPLPQVRLVALPAGADPAPVLAALATRALAAPVFVGRHGAAVIPTDEVLVRFHAGVPVAEQRRVLAAVGAQALAGPGWANLPDAWKLRFDVRDGAEALALANALADRADTRWANPNWIIGGRSDLTPTDPLFGDSWALHNSGQFGGVPDEDMDAPEAWDVELGDADVIVAVLDVGVEQDHPDIAQVPGEDFVFEGSGGDAFNACDNHGTAVAGCISGILDNGLGGTGAAPGCRVASARAFAADTFWCDGSWWTYIESTAEALAWADSIGARVSNNSNFYGFQDSSIVDAYAATRDAGMVHFASAGNFAVAFVEYPASLPTVMAVSATDNTGALGWFSSWGAGLDLSAPGVDVVSTDRTGGDGYYAEDYGFVSGTSFSSPFCAAAAALVVSRNPYLSAEQVESILLGSAVDHGAPGHDTVFGAGVVNLAAALAATPADPWTDLAGGIAGVAGIPQLVGSGSLLPASLGTLQLSDAVPGKVGLMFIALTSVPAPFKGGTLLATPVLLLIPVATNGSGEFLLSFTWPLDVPSDLGLHFQVALPDTAAIKDVSLSNGLKATTP